MKRGPPCAVCVHPHRSDIEAVKGAAQLRKALSLGVSRSALDRHRKHTKDLAPKGEVKSLPPPPTTEREALLDALAKAKHGLSRTETEDMPRLLNAITGISKRLEQLDKGREVTEADILNADAFRAILARFADALRPYPEAARAMLQALEAA